jgi:hypothetical protein
MEPKIGKYAYSISAVIGNIYGITAIEDVEAFEVIFDRVSISLIVPDMRVDVGTSTSIMKSGIYEYDNTAFEGTVNLNDTEGKNVVGKYGYHVIDIKDPIYGISTFSANEVYCIFDKVRIILSIADNRIEVGSPADITVVGKYVYDEQEFLGKVELNDTLTKSSIGRWNFEVSSLSDEKYGIKVFESNIVPSIWDRVIISTFSVEHDRIEVGKKALFNVSGVYEYDNTTWIGAYNLNDTDIKETIGKYSYRIQDIIDDQYGLKTFVQSVPDVQVIFDRIEVVQSVNSRQIGYVTVNLFASYKYDGLPVSNAHVLSNGLECQNLGEGKYKVDIPTWSMYLKISSSFSLEGYDTLFQNSETSVEGNILFYISCSLCIITAVIIVVAVIVIIRIRRHEQ